MTLRFSGESVQSITELTNEGWASFVQLDTEGIPSVMKTRMSFDADYKNMIALLYLRPNHMK